MTGRQSVLGWTGGTEIDLIATRKHERETKMDAITMTIEEYEQHREEYNGICTSCGEIRDGGTEPDAEEYECDACGKMAVQGIENAFMAGAIEIEE